MSWRYHGHIPTVDQFQHDLWSGVHTQFAVRTPTVEFAGMVVCYDLEPNHRFAKIATIISEQSRGIGTHATALFVRYLFQQADLRKLYFEVPDFNLERVGPLLSRFSRERSELSEHFFAHGAWRSLVTFGIWREDVEPFSPGLIEPSRALFG